MKTIMRKVVIPEWAKFIAQNALGDWYAYDFSPAWNDCAGWDAPDGKEVFLFTGVIQKPARDTLQRI